MNEAEDVESRPKIGRRRQPLQDREPLPGAKNVESRLKTQDLHIVYGIRDDLDNADVHCTYFSI